MNPAPTIYLDHAATTPMRPEAIEAMLPWVTTEFGNPSGSHAVARRARQAVDEARETIATCIGCDAGEVVFTSGGTEADNMAITGAVAAARLSRPGMTAVCSSIEHHAVLHPVEHAGGRTVAVSADALVDPSGFAAAIGDDTAVVSVMLANNEVGVVQPVVDIARAVRARNASVAVHTDAVQAGSWIDLRPVVQSVDLLSLAGHKLGGPKGVGVLYARRGIALEPLVLGGGQERDRRSGTHNVAGIVGMAAGLKAACDQRAAAVARLEALREEFVRRVQSSVPDVVQTASDAARLPNIAHLRIAGVESESLLTLLDDAGVCASAGSACASGAMEPSHVLVAMGVPVDEALSSLRVSLGWSTTEEEVGRAAVAVAECVARLRQPALRTV